MPINEGSTRPDILPSLGIALGGALWGLFWLPIRAISEFGLTGAWPGALIYGGCFILLLPMLVFRGRSMLRHWPALVICGVFTGTAFAAYATSLLMSEVVRVILLFYLTPVWGTLLGILLLGERLTANRATALVLGIAGLLVVLGAGNGFPWPRNLGDWLALASGMAWAYGSLSLYRMGSVAVPEQIFAFVAGGLAVTLAAIAIGGPEFGGLPQTAALRGTVLYAFLAAAFMLPTLFLTIWPATLLSPGRVGLLLMGEVVVGIVSAAILTGEPFGLREALGAALIVTAGAVEAFGRKAAV